MASLKDKVAIITGGASGIGYSAAELFLKEGAKVVISDINEDTGKKAEHNLKNIGDVFFVKADVSKASDCENLVNETVRKYKKLNVAFNNAGIGGESNKTADYSVEGWNHVIATNLNSVFFCMKYQIKEMLKSGGGAIVNNSSILGQVTFESAPAYVASKHGVVGVSKTAAVEYAKNNIRVNVIGPGFIHTPLISMLENDKNMNNMIVSMHPVGRIGQPEEVAELALWLCSDKASFVTGAYIPVDGGYLCR